MPRKAINPSLADASAAPGGAAAVDRALTLLAVFQAGDAALSLAELAARSQLYKSTVLRLLSSLEHARLLQRQGDGRYGLGPEVARLHGIYAASFSLDKVVLPALRELVAGTGESAAYHVRQGEARLCLYRVDSPHPIRDHVKAGDLLPMDRGTGARVLMAFDPDPARSRGPHHRNLLARIRAQGFYATSGDRLSGVAGISAPVFHCDSQGRATLAAALTLTMPAARYRDKYIKSVLSSARQLSSLLG